jgi:NADPH-dependent curcumin reductase CurA
MGGSAEATRWVLASRVETGLPDEKTFRKEAVRLPSLADGQILIRTTYVSLEPHTAGEIGPIAEGATGKALTEIMPPTALGATIAGYVLGEVIESRDRETRVGEAVMGYWGWQTLAVGRVDRSDDGHAEPADDDENIVYLANPDVRPVSYNLHILGELGITGYIGMTHIGKPQEGDVVFVSSAAGIVGGIAGQTAGNLGARVVGSVGSAAKAAYIVSELGFDAAVIHTAADIERRLDEACPDGIDVYFDGVGGPLSDLVIQRLRPHARVVLSGAIADWSASGPSVGPRLYWPLIASRATVQGYYVGDHHDQYEAAYQQVSDWVSDGRLTPREVIIDGFDSLPLAFGDFLGGKHHGKVIVRVGPEPDGWR